MGIVRCEACGNTELVKMGDFFVCQYCGCKYTLQDIQTQITNFNNTVNVSNHIDTINAENVYIAQARDFVINGGTLIKYNGESRDVIVPENVVSIGPGAFKDSYITSVGLPRGLKSIKYEAFSGCKSLRSINLPEGIEEIEDGAFHYTGIENITIPQTVKQLNKAVFLGNRKINNIYFKPVLNYFGFWDLMDGVEEIENIYFPEGIVFNRDVYADCSGVFPKRIGTIYLPSSVDLSSVFPKLTVATRIDRIVVGDKNISDVVDIKVEQVSTPYRDKIYMGRNFFGGEKYKEEDHIKYLDSVQLFVNGILCEKWENICCDLLSMNRRKALIDKIPQVYLNFLDIETKINHAII